MKDKYSEQRPNISRDGSTPAFNPIRKLRAQRSLALLCSLVFVCSAPAVSMPRPADSLPDRATSGSKARKARMALGPARGKTKANPGLSDSAGETSKATPADPAPAPAPFQERGMYSAGGNNQQVQANNAGALAGIPGSTVNFTSGALTLSPASGQDVTPLALIPSVSSPNADIFQVYKAGATQTSTCATNTGCFFAVQGNGNLYFAGNSATYGAPSQSTQSWLYLYGGSSANGGPYIHGAKNDGSNSSYLYFDPTQAGQLSIETSVVTGASTPANVICTHGNGQCGGGSGTLTSVGLSMPTGFTVGGSPVTTSGTLSVAGPLTSEGDLPYYHYNAWARLGVGGSGQCLTSNGADPVWGPCGGSGSVTSVALSLPNLFKVSGSPVTSSGTLSASLNSQGANLFLAGPLSGSAATPSFRGLAPADLGMTTEGDLLYDHSSALTRLGVGGPGQCLTSNGADPAWGPCGGSGSVTSVGLSLPAQFSISQSPVTSSGTLGGAWATLGASVTGDPNFPGMPTLLQRRTTMMLPAGGGANFVGVGDGISITGSGAAALPSASFPDVRVTICTGSTVHTSVGFSGNSIYRTGLSSNGSAGLFFNARADMNGATANYHAFLGLTDQAPATTMAGTSNDCKYKGIYAAISACTDGAYTSAPPYASTDWVCVTNNSDANATSQNAIDSGVAFDGNEHRFAIWEDVANAQWHFYIDGAEVCGTGTAADYPAATNLKLEYGATNTTTAAVTAGVAGFQVFSN